MKKNSNAFKIVLASCILSTGCLACSASNGTDGVEKFVSAVSSGAVDKNTVVSGPLIDRDFKVSSEFTAIKTKGAVDVIFTQSAENGDFMVKGSIPDNFMQFLEVKVEGSVLCVSLNNGRTPIKIKKGHTPTIFVTNKLLKEVTTNGSGDVIIKGNLDAPTGFSSKTTGSGDLEVGSITSKEGAVSISIIGSGDVDINSLSANRISVNIAGSGDVKCPGVSVSECSVSIAGSGDVELGGTCDNATFSVAGSGDIKAGKLQAASGTASVAGSGDISCNVKQLSKTISGSGSISNRQ